jgi:sulfatase maturation enzyme AslB (radical SAM superfamily)
VTNTTDISPDLLKEALQDPLFSKVRSVGLNGGEFTLVPNFTEILEAVLTLPKIEHIYLITNGLFPTKLFEYLQTGKVLCDNRSVSLHLCLSIDGVEEVHEKVRGIPHCFTKTKAILNELTKNKELYCHDFSVGCTLSRYNIANIRETEAFFNDYEDIHVEYHLAIPNKRIGTFADYQDYYVMNDERSRHLATEFFYGKYLTATDENYRRQCFANYYFLKKDGNRRLCTCDFLNRNITIDEQLNVALCATASDNIGHLMGNSATAIIHGKRAKLERRLLQRKYCDSCIHYSYHPLTIYGRWIYIQEEIRNMLVFRYYEARATKGWVHRSKITLSVLLRVIYNYLKLTYRIIWKLQ